MGRTWILAVMALGCSRAVDENLGLGERAVAVDVARLDHPSELLRALALPGAEIDRRLGARRVEARSTIEVAAGGRAPEKLEETFTLDSDGAGAFHVVHDNSRGVGMEAIATGGELYTRPRHGKFARRRPEGDESARLRQLVERAPYGMLEPLGRFCAVKDAGSVQLAGRSGRKLALSTNGSPGDAPEEKAPPRKWRETIEVRVLDGELVLEPASGALLGAKLEASYRFTRSTDQDKEPVAVTVHFSYDTNPPAPIAAPVESVPAPRRPRPLLDKQALLEGLTTSARKESR
jgi:hypothetical protein